MKKSVFLCVLAIGFWACGGSTEKKDTSALKEKAKAKTEMKKGNEKGIGETKNVVLNNPLDEGMITEGEQIYQLKCAACHKLSGKKVVGPGWEGVTKKRKPEWIMNMITNVDVMLDEDPVARKLFEECLTRMPNQNVSVKEARSLVEFMFKNDADRGVN